MGSGHGVDRDANQYESVSHRGRAAHMMVMVADRRALRRELVAMAMHGGNFKYRKFKKIRWENFVYMSEIHAGYVPMVTKLASLVGCMQPGTIYWTL